MQGKVTLITPPDFFHNMNRSILFIDIDTTEQDAISKWLAKNNFKDPINIYYYQGERKRKIM
jgi:hypothetical protein